jgi:hypothetical protein
MLVSSCAVFFAQKAAVVPTDFPVASHPDLLQPKRTEKTSDNKWVYKVMVENDPLAARYPWVPEPLYYGGKQSVGPLDVDWLWPDFALVDWNRDGLLDVVCALTSGTYWRLPKERQFRAIVFLNTGERHEGVPVFAEPYQVDLGFPLGSMVFDDIDGDGTLDLVTLGSRYDMSNGNAMFRWYRDTSKSGERRFEYVGNLQDFGNRADLKLFEKASYKASLQFVDWDGDGRKDLMVGSRHGNLNYFPRFEIGTGKGFAADGTWVGGDLQGSVVVHKNIGMIDGKPAFSAGRRLTAGDDERALSYFDTATAVATDWNDDGLLDVVVASFDNLFWYRNVGTRASPKLAHGVRIPVAGGQRFPYERGMVFEANWSPSDRHNLILQGSSFPWYLKNSGHKGAPRYDRIQTLQQKHPPVSGGDFTVVAAGDLDADGRPDLVLGNEDGFLLRVNNKANGFSPAVELEAGGKVFRVESPHGLQGPSEARWGYTIPVLTDWDGDGDLDLIVGSLHSYYLYLENTGTPAHAVFAEPQILKHDGKPLEVAWRARPVIYDFDGDGAKDLLALDGDGFLTTYYRKPSSKVEFERAECVLDDKGQPVKVGGPDKPKFEGDGEGSQKGRAMLALMDWDGDGSLDLLAGNAVENFDGLRWYKNVGTGRKWTLARQPNIALNLPWNHYSQVEPVDWDGDGKVHLLAGSEGGWVYLYRRR